MIIPDQCNCGGRIQYLETKSGDETWQCESCKQDYMRYHDVASGG